MEKFNKKKFIISIKVHVPLDTELMGHQSKHLLAVQHNWNSVNSVGLEFFETGEQPDPSMFEILVNQFLDLMNLLLMRTR